MAQLMLDVILWMVAKILYLQAFNHPFGGAGFRNHPQ
jgi:hypothetical protein